MRFWAGEMCIRDRVEPLSIDEAFVDLTGMEKLGGADKIAHAVQGRIEKELNLSASIGLAPNKRCV